MTDFNPGYPNIGKILNEHKHLFDLDQELKAVIYPDNIFVSFRGNSTLNDMLIHSKLPGIQNTTTDSTPSSHNNFYQGRCQSCPKKCVLCKNYLTESETVTSHHTNEIFNINDIIDCNTPNVVYLINDNICNVSYTGCTVDSMKNRFSNHKSHIKYLRRTCELSKHFSDNKVLHDLDKSSNKNYDVSLKNHLQIIAVEKVDISNIPNTTYDRLKACEIREEYWKNKLKTLKVYGGLNTR